MGNDKENIPPLFANKQTIKSNDFINGQRRLPGAGVFLDVENRRCLLTGLIPRSQTIHDVMDVYVSLSLNEHCTGMVGIYDAYCPCIAGNSKRCSHISSLVWLARHMKSQRHLTCTEQLSKWVDPGKPEGDVAKDVLRPAHSFVFTKARMPTDESETDSQPPRKRQKGARRSAIFDKEIKGVTYPGTNQANLQLKLLRHVMKKYRQEKKNKQK